jgi:ABC-type ATPase involved in cell division
LPSQISRDANQGWHEKNDGYAESDVVDRSVRGRKTGVDDQLARPAGRRSLTDGLVIDELFIELSVGAQVTRAVERFSMRAAAKTVTLLVGPSDQRSSSILGCLAGTVPLCSGAMWVNGVEVSGLDEGGMELYRREQVGAVGAAVDLLEHGSVADNIALAMRSSGLSRTEIRRRVDDTLRTVGLVGQANRRASQLSVGQARRVAIARSIAPSPVLLVIEEPFVGLDGVDFEEMVRTVRRCALAGSVVVATASDPRVIPVADQIVEMYPVASTTASTVGEPAPVPGTPARITLAAGSEIFGEGEFSDRVFCVDRGEVELRGPGGLDIIEEGAIFGEVAAVFGLRRTSNAVARTEVQLRSYTAEEFVRVYGPAELRRLLAGNRTRTRRS